MPFGLCNAPQAMRRLTDAISPDDLRHCVFGYLDDLCVDSDSLRNHVELAMTFMTFNVTKSKFCVQQVTTWVMLLETEASLKECQRIFRSRRRFIANFSEWTSYITETLICK